MKLTYIAVMHYTTRHGVDTILCRTNSSNMEDLPSITPELLWELDEIVFEDGEDAEWMGIFPFERMLKLTGGKVVK